MCRVLDVALIISLSVFAFTGCGINNDKKEVVSIESEIALLESNEEKANYLINLYKLDQEVRNDESNILRKYGYHTEEHLQAAERMMAVDRMNLQKIEAYLEQYGYPNLDRLGKGAVLAPWMIIHHQPEMEPRIRNFNYIYGAYENGDIDGQALSFFLNRMYKMKFGDMIKWDGPYTEHQEIDTLLKSLNLPK